MAQRENRTADLRDLPTHKPRFSKGTHVAVSLSRNGGSVVSRANCGFASMSLQRRREIASRGGVAAHLKGTAHEWTRQEAREASLKGRRQSRPTGDGSPAQPVRTSPTSVVQLDTERPS